jgi:hypothetical protein
MIKSTLSVYFLCTRRIRRRRRRGEDVPAALKATGTGARPSRSPHPQPGLRLADSDAEVKFQLHCGSSPRRGHRESTRTEGVGLCRRQLTTVLRRRVDSDYRLRRRSPKPDGSTNCDPGRDTPTGRPCATGPGPGGPSEGPPSVRGLRASNRCQCGPSPPDSRGRP